MQDDILGAIPGDLAQFRAVSIFHGQGRVIRGHGKSQLAAFLCREREGIAGGLSLGFELPVDILPDAVLVLRRFQILLDAGEEGIVVFVRGRAVRSISIEAVKCVFVNICAVTIKGHAFQIIL